ncbi:17.7 kDa class I heat shock protein [Bienertia sinuspersici]
MKVHPAPKKRNITLRYEIASPSSPTTPCRGQKKLRRLPHIFAKVLELPFCSDADVAIEESVNSFKFTVFDTDVASDVVADTVEIHPGVTKIVVRSNSVADVAMTEFELDLWRFRLPECTRPDLATATYAGGDLVVVVPKGEEQRSNGREVVWGEGNLVLVQ